MFKDFGIPNRIGRVSSNEELLKYINRWNGISNIYYSLYWYDILSVDEFGNEIRKSYIDKIFFDIDNDINSTKKLVDYLLIEDIQFHMNFSGNGHHIYISANGNSDGTNLRIAQLSILNAAKAVADMHIIGDVSRISRVVNSWNFKSQTYCIPITVEELGKEDGSKQRLGEKYIYGNKILNLESYTEDKFESIKGEIFADMKINTKIVLLPCIRNIVKKINPTHTERYTLVVYLSNALRNGKNLHGFDQTLLMEQIKLFFLENCGHWLDFNINKTMYQVKNIMPKTNIICGCKFLKNKGVCIGCIAGGI